ncbi:hypothetical protein GCM10023093_23850 [Nemorincola caseinilytica]|uniref:DUF6311 domain-containing protein n=1 Tax=Nemorincola caseinilytica TaxID=2054315 RepID=A0ABP8NL72_9BACT
MNRTHRNLWLAATVLLAVALTVLGFSYLVTEPWRMIGDIGGDGAKNNLTYLYHSAYGKGLWFRGMNYPYGEHIVFTDGIPVLSVLFAAMGNVDFPTALAVLWWLFGLGYVLSAVYLYKVLVRLTDVPLFSMVVAMLIAFLAPQFICIRGHYALAFTCIIPMFFYWTYMYHHTARYRYCVYMLVLGIISAFLHPYYAGMLLVWSAIYGVGYIIFTKGPRGQKIRHAATILAVGGATAVVVMLALKLTDPITDRPGQPYDPLESYTHLHQAISSYYSPFWHYAVDHGIVPGASDGGEGFSYIGLVPIAVLLVAVVLAVYRRVGKKGQDISTGMGPLWLFVALAALVFSMGIPFVWNMQWLKDLLPVFRQFRALGRFAWIFYYVITVYAAVVMYGWFARLKQADKRPLAWGLLLLAMSIWAYEVKGYMRTSRKWAEDAAYYYDVIVMKHEQNWENFLKEHDLRKDDFQAILLLKFFHVGTEKIWVGDPGWLITMGSRAALQLQLPIIDVMMSRSSWSQAQKQVKIVAGPYADKPMLRDLPNDKPFLLMKLNDDVLSPDDSYLLEASEYVADFSSCKIYKCFPARIRANDARHAAAIDSLLLYMQSVDTCVGAGTFTALHYDDGANTYGMAGSGGMQRIGGRDSVVATMSVPAAADSVLYEYSCWFLLDRNNCRSPEVRLELLDGAGNILAVKKAACNESVDSDDMWFRGSKYFYIPAACRQVRCRLINEPMPAYLAMDEMLLRPAAAVVVSRTRNGGVMVNGHLFKKGK